MATSQKTKFENFESIVRSRPMLESMGSRKVSWIMLHQNPRRQAWMKSIDFLSHQAWHYTLAKPNMRIISLQEMTVDLPSSKQGAAIQVPWVLIKVLVYVDSHIILRNSALYACIFQVRSEWIWEKKSYKDSLAIIIIVWIMTFRYYLYRWNYCLIWTSNMA